MKDNILRVMMIEPLGDGGIAHYTYNLLKALTQNGINSILYTNKLYEFEKNNLPFAVYNTMFCIANWLIWKYPILDDEKGIFSILRRVIKLIEYPISTINALLIARRYKIKIIHIQSVNLSEIMMVVAFKLISAHVIFTIHNVMPKHRKLRFYHKLIYHYMYRICDKIIIHTEKGKEEVSEIYNIDKNKINVIPHGDYKFFVPQKAMSMTEAKTALGIKPKCKTILFFGAIRKNKGLDNLLHSLPLIVDKIHNAVLFIVGEAWEDYKIYRKLITGKKMEANVWEKIKYIPNNELPIFFFASDVVVLPYNEVTGSGILQIAYAFSKPVVASSLAGFKETVVDGKNGYLVDSHDHRKMAEKIIDILTDDHKQTQMAKYSRFLADTQYGWEGIAKKTRAIYRNLSA